MAKREISSTLRNLKFMQRAAKNEEKAKKEEEVKPEGNFFPPGIVNRRCVVIMEGDPHPGAVIGRMSFQSFNPSIDMQQIFVRQTLLLLVPAIKVEECHLEKVDLHQM
ncbi:uncharacterized protein LOC110812062 isoform X2 [Carica papaya]|uniref:uncharacterized protein LOC110812062 isoform X2 n=1 Tax=Carica papaya TaxID=3649 RepID=UPI000B8C8C7F|nr:uncharacterized protein LOC110812062 isoform X2 [Carica papaya]